MALLAVFAALGFGLEWLFWWATTGFRQRLIAARWDRARAGARDRDARGLRAWRAACVRGRQHRGIPAVRMAAAAQADRDRLSSGVPDRAARPRARPYPPPPAPSASGSSRWRRLRRVSGSSGRRSWSAGSSSRGSRSTCSPCSGSADPPSIWWGSPAAWFWSGLLYVVWRHPARQGDQPASREHWLGASLLSVYVVVAWLSCLPVRRPCSTSASSCCCWRSRCAAFISPSHVLRPEGSATAEPVPSLTAVTVERGLRAALLIGGAYLIAWVLDLDLAAMSTRDTMATRPCAAPSMPWSSC